MNNSKSFYIIFFLSGPIGTSPSMENNLEEKQNKGNSKNLPTEKAPKRTCRRPGTGRRPYMIARSIARGTPGCLEHDQEPKMHMMEEQQGEPQTATELVHHL